MFKLKVLEVVAKEDRPKIDTPKWESIKKVVAEKLTYDPYTFGKPLRNTLKPARHLRIGDYRVLFVIQETTVIILAVQHKKHIMAKQYAPAIKRMKQIL